MDAKLIKRMGRKLGEFLGEFDDCFGRSGPREHLRTYVSGQLSDMPRKSIEPIALAAKVPPRTLQYFLSSMQWDQERMRDRAQWMVCCSRLKIPACTRPSSFRIVTYGPTRGNLLP